MPRTFFKSYGDLRAESYPTQDFLPGYKSDGLVARERTEQGDQLMSKHIGISPSPGARRDAKGQMSLLRTSSFA
jgi:hypothetical protein